MKKRTIKIKYKEDELLISAHVREASEEWLFCMHGLQSNKELFNPIFEMDALEKYSVIAFDFVGFGESSKPKGFSYAIEDQAEICKKIIATFGIKKIHLIGHSLGGMVGTLLLNDKVQSFINMEGNLVAEDCGTSAEVASMTFQQFQQGQFSDIILKLAHSDQKSEQIRCKWVTAITDFAFYKTSISIVEWSKNGKLLDFFAKFPHKKLYIFGSKNAHKVKGLPREIQTAEISNSGHFMILENPEETYAIITRFITKDG